MRGRVKKSKVTEHNYMPSKYYKRITLISSVSMFVATHSYKRMKFQQVLSSGIRIMKMEGKEDSREHEVSF